MTKIPLTSSDLDNVLNYIYKSTERGGLEECEDLPQNSAHLTDILNKYSAVLNTEVELVDGSYNVTAKSNEITYNFEINYNINLKGTKRKPILNTTKIEVTIPFNGEADEVMYNGKSSDDILHLFTED